MKRFVLFLVVFSPRQGRQTVCSSSRPRLKVTQNLFVFCVFYRFFALFATDMEGMATLCRNKVALS